MSTRLAEPLDRATSTLAYRPALDGLRGLAVVVVVLYHLEVPGFGGGFIGVDVFFVLSGFLITSLLMEEHGNGGRIDLARFWARRARRLLPALITVVLATMAAMPAISMFSTTGDGLASLFYAANWRFILTSQSYFVDAAASTPFRHMWSLAVEEHFYLLWPLAFVLLWRLPLRRRITWIGAAAAVSAMVMAAVYSPANPSRAYFGTDARVHQILIGIAIAVLLRHLRGGIVVGRYVGLAGAGLLAIFVASASDQGATYYLGGAAFVALAAAAIVFSVETAPGSVVHRALAAKPLIELGKRSYGIYLWHWPIIVWLELRGWGGWSRALGAVRATLLFSWLSYRHLEQPIRHSQTLSSGTTLIAGFGFLALGALGAVALGGRYEEPSWVTSGDAGMVTAGFDSTPRPVLALVGDSVAASLVPGLQEAATEAGYAFVSMAARGCGLADGRQVGADGAEFTYTDRCDALVPEGIERMLEETRPDIVLWYSGRESSVHFEMDGHILAPGSEAHDQYITAELEQTATLISATGAELVIIEPYPVPGEGCHQAPESEFCVAVRERQSSLDHLSTILHRVSPPGAAVVDLRETVCLGDVDCDPELDGARVREDGNHFSEGMSRAVAPGMLALTLQTAGLDPGHHR